MRIIKVHQIVATNYFVELISDHFKNHCFMAHLNLKYFIVRRLYFISMTKYRISFQLIDTHFLALFQLFKVIRRIQNLAYVVLFDFLKIPVNKLRLCFWFFIGKFCWVNHPNVLSNIETKLFSNQAKMSFLCNLLALFKQNDCSDV